jgi:hypothetical protein
MDANNSREARNSSEVSNKRVTSNSKDTSNIRDTSISYCVRNVGKNSVDNRRENSGIPDINSRDANNCRNVNNSSRDSYRNIGIMSEIPSSIDISELGALVISVKILQAVSSTSAKQTVLIRITLHIITYKLQHLKEFSLRMSINVRFFHIIIS